MSADDGPQPPDGRRSEAESGSPGPLRRVWTASSGPLLLLRETALSVGSVVVIGLLLFAISGIWPPMVAVESGSMEPHMHKGDLVFITDTGRFAPDAAYDGTGVVPLEQARETGYWKFGDHGSVIVYDNPKRGGPPVIHRARFWVSAGENWYDRADPAHVDADSCTEMRNCPAPNAGFVTKGDANARYDQVNGLSEPVKPAWIVGVARVRVPLLGWVRLGVSGTLADPAPGTTGVVDEPTVWTRPAVDRGAVDPASMDRPTSTVGPASAPARPA